LPDGNVKVEGASAYLFNELTRETIHRKLERLDTDDLLRILAHLIALERKRC